MSGETTVAPESVPAVQERPTTESGEARKANPHSFKAAVPSAGPAATASPFTERREALEIRHPISGETHVVMAEVRPMLDGSTWRLHLDYMCKQLGTVMVTLHRLDAERFPDNSRNPANSMFMRGVLAQALKAVLAQLDAPETGEVSE